MDKIAFDVQYLKGVGPKRAQLFKKLNIKTFEDLIYYKPEYYDDRTVFRMLNEVEENEKASFKLKVIGSNISLYPRRGMNIIKFPVSDGINHAYLTWFNQEYIKYQLEVGKTYIVTGRKKSRAGEIQISNPDFKEYKEGDTGSILPVYSLTEGLTNRVIWKIIKQSLEEHYYKIEEILPSNILLKYGMMGRNEALKTMHKPDSSRSLLRALNRLKFEEFLILQLGLFLIKSKNISDESGLVHKGNTLVENFLKSLPFNLTKAQKRVFKEIKEDMESDLQMNRLVQGDVGSGKTVVALLAMLKAVDSGYQASMMAPTEILASQHYLSIKNFLKETNIKVGLLVGSMKKSEKEELLIDLKNGRIDILVGTHAIIQENVEFKSLGLVITDEQHRFGVEQRNMFSRKGNNPDILVMTATPIPRTLALILYGDLDISIIDELPPGRKEIETYAVAMNMEKRVHKFIDLQIEEGRQAYVVCPLIEENENINVKSVEEVYEHLKNHALKHRKIGLLHGQMSTSEKDNIMDSFKNKELDVLISTTVIEVGVDVSNANMILIYNGERFGLAQLHQLRGRVGRGSHQSYCIILHDSKNEISMERMRVMQSSSDGFIISEKDLELRGPGEFFGTRQHGLPELKIANLFTDMPILKLAQKEANIIINLDPRLESQQNFAIKSEIIRKFKKFNNISFN